MVTNCKLLFGVPTKATCRTEKIVKNDLQTESDVFKSFEVCNVVLVNSKYEIADALKMVETHSKLIDVILQGKIKQPIEQLIIRNDVPDSGLTEENGGVSI